MFFAIADDSSSDSLRIVVMTGSKRACSDGSEVLKQPTTQFFRYVRFMAAFRPVGAEQNKQGEVVSVCYNKHRARYNP